MSRKPTKPTTTKKSKKLRIWFKPTCMTRPASDKSPPDPSSESPESVTNVQKCAFKTACTRFALGASKLADADLPSALPA